MSNNKVKGLLKGLRYISQIFDNEKEPEMQIGLPTDVKHVAHIGWDGPSVNSPSWMNEFQSTPGLSSAPDASSVQRDSPGANQTARDMPELPKASRRQSSTAGGKSKKSSKPKEPSSSEGRRSTDVNQSGGEADAPKKARRKKSKEEGTAAGSRPKATAAESCSSQFCENGSDAGSVVGSDDLLTRDGVFT